MVSTPYDEARYAEQPKRGADKDKYSEITVDDVTGAFRYNRFIAFFDVPDDFDPSVETRKFRNSFVNIFNPNIARLFATKDILHSEPVFGFRLNDRVKNFLGHIDYIALSAPLFHFSGSTSFVGKTLFSKEMIPFLSIDSQNAGLIIIDHINRHHFLAGRRSWTIGRQTGTNLGFIETIALEKFSLGIYELMGSMINVDDDIRQIWVTLLKNFERHHHLKFRQFEMDGFRNDGNVYSRFNENETLDDVWKDEWYYEGVQHNPFVYINIP